MRGLRLLPILALAACKPADAPPPSPTPAPAATGKLAGVYPADFKCESLLTQADLEDLLGGTVRVVDSPMSVPRGLARPCNYLVERAAPPTPDAGAPAPEAWTFDLDCRDGYEQRADALMAQYRATSADLVATYDQLADAGALRPDDAGFAHRAPQASAEVAIGKRGLDHHGQGLVFVDDDAPCYVRVIGPDDAHRLELATRLATRLTFANAPMTPRPAR